MVLVVSGLHDATGALIVDVIRGETMNAASSSFDPEPSHKATCGGPENLTFELIHQHHADRSLIEEGIAQRFSEAYGADVVRFMPYQLCVRLDNSAIATLGIRFAEFEPLFLENYLDVPVEHIASHAIGREIERKDIVEIGNLVSHYRGASQCLFVALTLLLCDAGKPWVTFTATPEVQKLLRRLNILPVALVQADAERLGAEKNNWGTYYDQKPLVMITHAPTAKLTLLSHPLFTETTAKLLPLVEMVQRQWRSHVNID